MPPTQPFISRTDVIERNVEIEHKEPFRPRPIEVILRICQQLWDGAAFLSACDCYWPPLAGSIIVSLLLPADLRIDRSLDPVRTSHYRRHGQDGLAR